jgi:hypothetical protein
MPADADIKRLYVALRVLRVLRVSVVKFEV